MIGVFFSNLYVAVLLDKKTIVTSYLWTVCRWVIGLKEIDIEKLVGIVNDVSLGNKYG